MAKQCYICEKGSLLGGRWARFRATNYNPAGKKRRYPNLQWATFPDGPHGTKSVGGKKRAKICTRCLKKNRHLAK